jgi:competence protein ComEC
MTKAAAVVLATLLIGCGGPGLPGPREPRHRGHGTAPSHAGDNDSPRAEPAATMTIHLIDVGQGAATLVEFSCGAVLIDTGGEANDEFNSTEHLVAYLEAFFARRPDLHETLALVVLTHPHIDHTRGVGEVWRRYHVLNVVTNGLDHGSGGRQQAKLQNDAQAAGIGYRAIRIDQIPAGGLTDPVIDPITCSDGDPDIRVLWGAVPDPDALSWTRKAAENANNQSVAIRVSLGKGSLLVTGDLETEAIDELLRRQQASGALDVDVYEVGHHGSANGTTNELVQALSPELALIAAGPASRQEMWTAWAYGHPREAVVRMLAAAMHGARPKPAAAELGTGAKRFVQENVGARIYSNAWDGDVDVTLSAAGASSVTTAH